MENKYPLVSVIIPVKNGSRYIKKCLDSIFAQDYSNIEIIIVDNGSTDNTKDLCSKYNVTILDHGGTLSEIRSFGVLAVKGFYLFFIDADQYLSRDLISDCVHLIKFGKSALVVKERSAYNSFLASVFSLERHISEVAGRGAPRFFEKGRYLQIGGHRKDLMFGEDFDLATRMSKQEIGLTEKIIYHHDIMLLNILFSKYVKYGRTLHTLNSMNKNSITFNNLGLLTKHIFLSFFKSPIQTVSVVLIKCLKFVAIQYGHFTR